MERRDNYVLQAQAAKARFLTYDQNAIIRKFQLDFDRDFLYTTLLAQPYRICRRTGDLEKWERGTWTDANSHGEVLTLFDLLCDARDVRCLSGRYQSTQNFGMMFHRNLTEDQHDPLAARFDREPALLHRGCAALNGTPLPHADIAYRLELFDDLPIMIHFWHGDEEFAPRLRFLWDANSLQYLRYETMYFAVSLLRKKLGGT